MYILFDIGGTKTRIAGSADLKSFFDVEIFDTNQTYYEGIKTLQEKIEEISGEETVEGIAGGIPGIWDKTNNRLAFSPNLPDWVGKDLKEDLESFFHTEVYIENDASMVALGEAKHGAGRGFVNVAYVTVSTGVGGAHIIGGKIDEKTEGSEPGHKIIEIDSTLYPDAKGHSLESLIGGHSIERREGKKPKEITDETFWDNAAKILALGLTNSILEWQPEVIVIGGSMMKDVGIKIDQVQKYLTEINSTSTTLPQVKKAELDDEGGLFGAMTYLDSKI